MRARSVLWEHMNLGLRVLIPADISTTVIHQRSRIQGSYPSEDFLRYANTPLQTRRTTESTTPAGKKKYASSGNGTRNGTAKSTTCLPAAEKSYAHVMFDAHQKPLVSLDEIIRAEYLFAECTEHIDKTPQCHRDSAGGGCRHAMCSIRRRFGRSGIFHGGLSRIPFTIPTKLFVKGFLR